MINSENTHLVLFPQLLGVYKFDKHEELKKEIKTQIGIHKGSEFERKDDDQGIVHYFNNHDQNFFDDQKENIDIIEDFRSFVIRRTNQYADEMGHNHPGFFVSDAWVNIANKGSYQHAHNHINSFISGTYYVSYDKEKHPPLRFKSPHSYIAQPFIGLDRIERKNHVFGYEYECDWLEEGMLLLWQSGMHHTYGRNFNDDRISISMNMFPRVLKCGEYGVNFT
jgi:uncharacterized protein (TIGR02466 family)